MFDSSRVAMPTPESAPRGRSSPILPADAEHYLSRGRSTCPILGD